MESREQRLLTAAWGAVAVVAVGVVADVRWHAAHGSADGIDDLVAGHGLIWIGVLVTVAIAAIGARRRSSVWYSGWGLLLAGAIGYAASEGLHVWSHGTGHARVLTHVLMQLSKVGVVAGVISATVATKQRSRDRTVTTSAD